MLGMINLSAYLLLRSAPYARGTCFAAVNEFIDIILVTVV